MFPQWGQMQNTQAAIGGAKTYVVETHVVLQGLEQGTFCMWAWCVRQAPTLFSSHSFRSEDRFYQTNVFKTTSILMTCQQQYCCRTTAGRNLESNFLRDKKTKSKCSISISLFLSNTNIGCKLFSRCGPASYQSRFTGDVALFCGGPLSCKTD